MQGGAETTTAPDRQGFVLAALVLVAAVANLNLAVANVALPEIGKAFDAGQTALNLLDEVVADASPSTWGPITIPRIRSRTTTGGERPAGSAATIRAATVAATTTSRNELSSTPIIATPT